MKKKLIFFCVSSIRQGLAKGSADAGVAVVALFTVLLVTGVSSALLVKAGSADAGVAVVWW